MSVIDVFLACHSAIRSGVLIDRADRRDKEFHFQDWFAARLTSIAIGFDKPSRNAYPDFTLVHRPEGYETKGLAFPGRVANYDCNSQVPSGQHGQRRIYYVFGRYPNEAGSAYPVYDLVVCDGDFLNADHEYVHKNRNIKGFGSYGDLMIRDRKMYVAPTPFALAEGTQGQLTLIVREDEKTSDTRLRDVGELERTEAEQLVTGYSFDLRTNELSPELMPNPNAGRTHRFVAYRAAIDTGPRVRMSAIQREQLLAEEEDACD
jgi:hypothetical protein